MTKTCNCGHIHNRSTLSGSIDPTRTFTLRQRFKQRLHGSFNKIKSAIKQTIVDNDFFGLESKSPFAINSALVQSDGQFLTMEQKLERFNQWLSREVATQTAMTGGNSNLFKSFNSPANYRDAYVKQAYKQGLRTAYSELKAKNVIDDDEDEPDVDSNTGNNRKYHELLLLLLLLGRNEQKALNEKAVAAVTRQIVKEISIDLPKPRIVNKAAQNALDGVVDITADAMVDYLVVSSFNAGLLDFYASNGVKEVGAIVEWVTAGDRKVCSFCNGMAGKTFTVGEAIGLLPAHPHCRCRWQAMF